MNVNNNSKVYVLTKLEIGLDIQNDTSLTVIGVYDSFNKAKEQKNLKAKEQEKLIQNNINSFEIDCDSFYYEIVGEDGYFYQLLIIEQSVL